jgi:hypothetical protein
MCTGFGEGEGIRRLIRAGSITVSHFQNFLIIFFEACSNRRWNVLTRRHPAIKNDSGALPESPKWQRIRNQIDAAMIFAGSDFVNVL